MPLTGTFEEIFKTLLDEGYDRDQALAIAYRKTGKGKKNAVVETVVESPKGSLRHGPYWVQRMANDYGYIVGTMGVDGDEIDCFLGPNESSDRFFVIEQNKADGEFDEHKVMLGFSNLAEAKDAYFANYPDSWSGFRNITEYPINKFWDWAKGVNSMKKENVFYSRTRDYKGYTLVAEGDTGNWAGHAVRGGQILFDAADRKRTPEQVFADLQRQIDMAKRNVSSLENVNKGDWVRTDGGEVGQVVGWIPGTPGLGNVSKIVLKTKDGREIEVSKSKTTKVSKPNALPSRTNWTANRIARGAERYGSGKS